ncbi:peptide chain release factor 1 [Dictyobacter alpinus]|uniref:Peptide chain release factor 1 n=1 Tax=Dictyobacter alpinus TaxID=2014873 RepID=A0A402BF26_9CHLR|nr:Vms1/Ankzf1 family peptidyl-tRNA hydrolase [Dictyobacter alpinus]GCE29983.1 peptide chain release factor 1 [Dictyobacter alpinus]
MQTAQELFHKLASFEPDGAYVLSIYLDMSPHMSGKQPWRRTSTPVLKKRLREIEKTLQPRHAMLDAFRKDAEKVQAYMENHVEPWLQGMAIFSCSDYGLFEVLEAGVSFQNQVMFEPYPDLFQLARLLDEQETVITAIVDTNTTRLFVTRRGFLEEVAGPDDSPRGYGKRNATCLNQARYHRRAENKRKEFAREAASAIEDLVQQEGARRVILAGDAVAIPLLHQELSSAIEPLVHEETLKLDITTPHREVQDEIQPIIEYMERESSHSQADNLVEAIRANGLAVSGMQETLDALDHGQADVLLMSDDVAFDEKQRSELVRKAANTGAKVDVVKGHPVLQEMGGVGALLRYHAHWV